MKKFFLVLTLCCMIFFISCEAVPSHTHKWDNGTITTAATCTEKGVKTFKCSCGATKTEEIAIDPDNHDLSGGYEPVKEATFLEKGQEKATCTRCKKEITRETEVRSLVGTSWDFHVQNQTDALISFIN